MNIPPFSHIFRTAVIALIAVAVAIGFFFLGFGFGQKVPETIIVKGISNTDTQVGNVDFGIFWQAWQTISNNYLRDASTTNQQKVYGAVNGLVNSLGDPYT